MEKTWFELGEIRRRRLGDAVWIPLFVSEYIIERGKFGYVGYVKEYYGLGSVAIPTSRREEGEKLSWSDLGGHNQGIWATEGYYKPAEVYQYNDRHDLGIELVLIQYFPTEDPKEWHLNQDLIFALGLKRECDSWVKPDEDYIEVARIRRNAVGKAVALEIKNDFLRDYLCARNMFLKTSMYRERTAIVGDIADIGSPEAVKTKTETEHFEIRISPIIEGGHFGDGGYAVFHVSRTDIDPEEDVPLPGPETDANTKSESWQGRHEGKHLAFISGELWRTENIEPAPTSPRVRGDKVPGDLKFIVDAAGNKVFSEELNDEDNARWLWFRPDIVPAITSRRSGAFTWYTKDTGGVGLSGARLLHFGINKVGLINVYAYDIASLPLWQKQVWAGYNIVPEGGVSEELLASQMRAEPANTSAPERDLPEIMKALDDIFRRAIGTPLFRAHPESQTIIGRITRFRALSPGGLFALAKDLSRVIADQIDTAALQKVLSPPKGEKWASLKSLEKYLASLASADKARTALGALAGAYDLRLADAHMPKAELESAYNLAQVNSAAMPIVQGFELIAAVASALITILRLMHQQFDKK